MINPFEIISNITEVVSQELQVITFENIIVSIIIVFVARFFSKFAKNTIPRLIWISIGIYSIYSAIFKTPNNIILDIDMFFGIGFILPHAKFFIEWIYNLYESLKSVTINGYYFITTIYFKVRKVVLWFYNTFLKIYSFFQQTSHKENTKEEYQKEYKQSYKSYNNKEKAKQRREERQKEEESYDYEKEYEEYKKEQGFYEEENNESYKNSNSNYEDEYEDEFAQFYSDDDYVVLGVSPNDDFDTIKSKYKKLVFKYHPDKNYEEYDKYNEILQKINASYEELKKIYGE